MNKEAKVRAAIDWEKGVEGFGGDEQMFTEMVAKIEGMTLDQLLENLYNSVMSKDWEKIRSFSHQLKGPTSYIYAMSVQELALQLQLKCDAFLKPENAGKVSERQKAFLQNDGIGLYLSLLHEMKYLKERIAQVTKQRCDISKIEFYEKNAQPLYDPNLQPQPEQCGGCCKIF